MAEGCCAPESSASIDPRYRRVLWLALLVNLVMGGVEIGGGVRADSVSLLADAVDFFGDAANYGLSLYALALAPIWRSRTALVKGLSMGAYGAFVLGKTGWNTIAGAAPEPFTMGAIGALAFIANLSVALMLYRFRNGDANMRSVWLCSRNDAIINVAVVVAALGVFGTGSAWPDLAVAAGIAALALGSARTVVSHSIAEMRFHRETVHIR
jgi:Co/Zn/Cd efflux system component